MEVAVSIIEGVKGMTGYGLIALGMLCATASWFGYLRVTHSVAWLQATPEQIQARALFGRKPLNLVPPAPLPAAAQALPEPPKDPPSPVLPLVIMMLLAACMLWPRGEAGLALLPVRHLPACVERTRSAPLGDYAVDLRPQGPRIYLAGYR